jgi:hypothetical protein
MSSAFNSKISNWLLYSTADSANSKKRTKSYKKSSIASRKKKKSNNLNLIKKFQDEDKELTKSPIAGTYIIKDWSFNDTLNNKNSKKESQREKFTKNDVVLNSLAASFVEITPQARAKLDKIPNKIGPYECKLCKIVFEDAFQLAMHNCPRVVHLEYR